MHPLDSEHAEYVWRSINRLRSLTFTSVSILQLEPMGVNITNTFSFYPRDAMLARVIVITTCLSVRPSVRPSVSHALVLCQNEVS